MEAPESQKSKVRSQIPAGNRQTLIPARRMGYSRSRQGDALEAPVLGIVMEGQLENVRAIGFDGEMVEAAPALITLPATVDGGDAIDPFPPAEFEGGEVSLSEEGDDLDYF